LLFQITKFQQADGGGGLRYSGIQCVLASALTLAEFSSQQERNGIEAIDISGGGDNSLILSPADVAKFSIYQQWMAFFKLTIR